MTKEQCDHDWSVVAESHGRVVACLKCGRSQDSFTSNPVCGYPAGDCVLADELTTPLRAEIERLRAALDKYGEATRGDGNDPRRYNLLHWLADRLERVLHDDPDVIAYVRRKADLAREALRPADETADV